MHIVGSVTCKVPESCTLERDLQVESCLRLHHLPHFKASCHTHFLQASNISSKLAGGITAAR